MNWWLGNWGKPNYLLNLIDDIKKDWELLSFLMDSRTGLGRFRDFRIANYELMMNLIDYCAKHTIRYYGTP